MTPKGLLRLREATSTLADLAESAFQPVLDDPMADHAATRRLVLCSGKVYYDIIGHELRASMPGVAVARIEQLYPFPLEQASELIAAYPELQQIVWAQEEPQNMGAWRSLRHRLEEAAAHAPACGARAVRRPHVACEHERGVSHPAPVRAGPDRARGARRRRRLDPGTRPAGKRRREARAVLPRRQDDLPALLGGQAAPRAIRDECHRGRPQATQEEEGDADRDERHGRIVAHRARVAESRSCAGRSWLVR